MLDIVGKTFTITEFCKNEIELYRKYLIIGGMPEMVEDFIANDLNILNINKKILEDIIVAYFNDMNKYVSNKAEAIKNEAIYKSIPVQIGNKSNKFQYMKINKNARSREYETSLCNFFQTSN